MTKPLLLRLAALFLGFWGVIALPAGLAALLASEGTYVLDGVAVGREEFMDRAGVAFALLPVLGAIALAIAWGIVKERRWARPLLLGFFTLGPLVPTVATLRGHPEGASLLPWMVGLVLLIGALLGWYLYARRNVVDYYRSLERR